MEDVEDDESSKQSVLLPLVFFAAKGSCSGCSMNGLANNGSKPGVPGV